jgi:hypothetical protein
MHVIEWKTLVEDPRPRGSVNPVVRHGKGQGGFRHHSRTCRSQLQTLMPMLLPASEPSPLVKISTRGGKTPMQVSPY